MRAGERIYINGAVLRVDRKVSLELVNDVMFLLEGQVMQAADATTAMRQLYFIVQLMLMNPTDVGAAACALSGSITRPCSRSARTARCWTGSTRSTSWSAATRYFEALKRIRALFPDGAGDPAPAPPAESPVEAA